MTLTDQDTTATTAPAGRRQTVARCGGVAAAVALTGCAALGAAGTGWVAQTAVAVLFVAVVAAGAWLSVIDARTRRLPNAIVTPLAGVVAVGAASIAAATGDAGVLWFSLIGAVSMWLLYLVLGLAGGVGTGDIKVAAILGAWAGTTGWHAVLAAAVLAYVLALPHTLIVITRRRTVRNTIPFGPYLIGGAVLGYVLTVTGVL